MINIMLDIIYIQHDISLILIQHVGYNDILINHDSHRFQSQQLGVALPGAAGCEQVRFEGGDFGQHKAVLCFLISNHPLK